MVNDLIELGGWVKMVFVLDPGVALIEPFLHGMSKCTPNIMEGNAPGQPEAGDILAGATQSMRPEVSSRLMVYRGRRRTRRRRASEVLCLWEV